MRDKTPTRILFYGAGVIGSLYAALLANTGAAVSVFARGKRLAEFRAGGLRYFKNGRLFQSDVCVLDRLMPDDCYDYIFLAVRAEQLYGALTELRSNCSPTIVTMVNSLEDYDVWETLCGKGRILPAFPGAGGGWKAGVLDAALTPRLIQPTTFGEIGGKATPRAMQLKQILQSAGVPCQMVPDMQLWQLCHLAMVVPLADAYYLTKGDPAAVTQDKAVMAQTASALHENFKNLKVQYGHLSPGKMNLFCILPPVILRRVLPLVYQSAFGDQFMYQHAMKAPEEMAQLHEEFYSYIGEKR